MISHTNRSMYRTYACSDECFKWSLNSKQCSSFALQAKVKSPLYSRDTDKKKQSLLIFFAHLGATITTTTTFYKFLSHHSLAVFKAPPLVLTSVSALMIRERYLGRLNRILQNLSDISFASTWLSALPPPQYLLLITGPPVWQLIRLLLLCRSPAIAQCT